MQHKKYTIKQILLSNNNWWRFYLKYHDKLRPSIVICIVKLLSCKHSIRGYREYGCSNPHCSHVKYIAFTCKGKACSSCGKKATELGFQAGNPGISVRSVRPKIFKSIYSNISVSHRVLNVLMPQVMLNTPCVTPFVC